MIAVLDLDLASSCTPLPPRGQDAWVLTWLAGRVVGEVRVAGRPGLTPDELRAAVVRALAERLNAMESIRVAPTGTEPAVPEASDVTIAVCTRDRPELLDGCLASLRRLDPAPGGIIVVDNASRGDATSDVAARHSVRCVRAGRPGLNRARNVAWREADTDVVAYVDDDARPAPTYARAIAAPFGAPHVGAVTGLVRPGELLTRAQVAFEVVEGGMGKGYDRRVFDARSAPVRLDLHRCGVGTNLAVRRDLLGAFGGFDERIGVGTPTRGGCDLDLFARVLDAGATIVYEPDAVVRHLHRRTTGALLAQVHDYGVTLPALLTLHAREGRVPPADVARYLRRWHRARHVERPLRAVARRRWLEVRLARAEHSGSRRARAALDAALADARDGSGSLP